jgi:hypothetical protein
LFAVVFVCFKEEGTFLCEKIDEASCSPDDTSTNFVRREGGDRNFLLDQYTPQAPAYLVPAINE